MPGIKFPSEVCSDMQQTHSRRPRESAKVRGWWRCSELLNQEKKKRGEKEGGGQGKGESYWLIQQQHVSVESLSWLLSNQEKAFQRARG